MANYRAKTANSRNLLRRWAHRARFRHAQEWLIEAEPSRILDYGCGDAALLMALRDEGVKSALTGFEPYMSNGSSDLQIYKEWDEVLQHVEESSKFDCVTLLEVLEHLPAPVQAEAVSQIRDVINPCGRVLVSVPVESGLPSLVKNLARKISYPQSKLYSWRNILKAALGMPVPEGRVGEGMLTHMGFDFRGLEAIMDGFQMVDYWTSPLKGLPAGLNSQVYGVFRLGDRDRDQVKEERNS